MNSIRRFTESDTDAVLDIWLSASIKAHDFIAPEFWRSRLGEMRRIYLPNAESYVLEKEGVLLGFCSLVENTLAALFVHPEAQGQGGGSALMHHAKAVCTQLELMVYEKNESSVAFYLKQGFSAESSGIDEHTGEREIRMVWSRIP